MKESKRLECLYCKRVALWSERYELYVCDDCYAKGLGRDKAPILIHGFYSEDK